MRGVRLDLSPSCCFFVQAEDGIRDLTVTGVQTCALPISRRVVAADRERQRLRAIDDRVRERIGRELLVPLRVQEASDRKSTRLNSSHSQISYAVFCLKKKKKKKIKSS